MLTNLFSIYDSAAKAFMEPFHAATIESAIRSFRYTVNNHDNNISKYPEDYTLFHLGEFDMTTGLITPNETPHNLGVAVTFLESSNAS